MSSPTCYNLRDSTVKSSSLSSLRREMTEALRTFQITAAKTKNLCMMALFTEKADDAAAADAATVISNATRERALLSIMRYAYNLHITDLAAYHRALAPTKGMREWVKYQRINKYLR